MGKVRPLNEKKYNIDKHRFLELYYHCMQYPKWKEELKYIDDTVRSVQYGTMRGGGSNGSALERAAIKRRELEEKCELIEQTVMEADPDICKYILTGVTQEYATFKYLKHLGLPCERDMYYDRRRKFYYLLSQKI